MASGCILQFKGKSQDLENTPKLLKFSLVKSNSVAFYFFIKENKNISIDLRKVDLDYFTMKKLFKGVKENTKF